MRGLRRGLDRVEPGDEESPLVVGHELAVEAIEERRDADVRGAGCVGARQDAIRGGAGDSGLHGREIGLRRRRLRARDERHERGRERHAGEDRRTPDRLASVDGRSVDPAVGWRHVRAHRLCFLISLTAWSQARAVRAM